MSFLNKIIFSVKFWFLKSRLGHAMTSNDQLGILNLTKKIFDLSFEYGNHITLRFIDDGRNDYVTYFPAGCKEPILGMNQHLDGSSILYTIDRNEVSQVFILDMDYSRANLYLCVNRVTKGYLISIPFTNIIGLRIEVGGTKLGKMPLIRQIVFREAEQLTNKLKLVG